MNKISNTLQLVRQMGRRAFVFRAGYELRKRTGLLKRRFPVQVLQVSYGTLQEWKQQAPRFFFDSREQLNQSLHLYTLNPSGAAMHQLNADVQRIRKGEIPFFNAQFLPLGTDYDWLTHPQTGFPYPATQHWTDIRELDPAMGDIKFVWEKSRFSYLYPIIRYDFHAKDPQDAFVLQEIESWIDANLLNCGPNYVCSQEISLRVLNWTFALHYYKHSPELTEARFQKIIHSIGWQIRHVAANIDFSRIAIRNNHAITECLALYLVGLLYPFFPESARWRENGKKWLTEEGLYQIYPDGSYLQFSMNYHRVVVQLFTWAFVLADRNKDRFDPALYERLKKSLNLLYQHQDLNTGHLPNYGANDGALFFWLNACTYRDFRPQLQALHHYLYGTGLYEHPSPEEKGTWEEDTFWYGMPPADAERSLPAQQDLFRADTGGFYVLRKAGAFASVRCGSHPDRPSQADNLHLDLWAEGVNLMRDAGSYKYNTDSQLLRYFMGTASHNTLQLADYDQMQKGGRFIWYYWSRAMAATLSETADYSLFEGKIQVYRHLHPQVYHIRRIWQYTYENRWVIEDQLELPESLQTRQLPVRQRWHPHPDFDSQGWRITCQDKTGQPQPIHKVSGWYASFYGLKEPAEDWYFENKDGYFLTTIKKL